MLYCDYLISLNNRKGSWEMQSKAAMLEEGAIQQKRLHEQQNLSMTIENSSKISSKLLQRVKNLGQKKHYCYF